MLEKRQGEIKAKTARVTAGQEDQAKLEQQLREQKHHTDKTLKEVDGLTQKVAKLQVELEDQVATNANLYGEIPRRQARAAVRTVPPAPLWTPPRPPKRSSKCPGRSCVLQSAAAAAWELAVASAAHVACTEVESLAHVLGRRPRSRRRRRRSRASSRRSRGWSGCATRCSRR